MKFLFHTKISKFNYSKAAEQVNHADYKVCRLEEIELENDEQESRHFKLKADMFCVCTGECEDGIDNALRIDQVDHLSPSFFLLFFFSF